MIMPLPLMSNYIDKKLQKKLLIAFQFHKFGVCLLRYFKLCFCTQGLINPVETGIYCSVSNIQQVSVFVLTITPNQALCLNGRVGTEYNSLTANNVRRFRLHGFLTSRSPYAKGKVL